MPVAPVPELGSITGDGFRFTFPAETEDALVIVFVEIRGNDPE
jgi:hypothetical protein